MVPLPHHGGVGGEVSVGLAGLAAAAAVESFPGDGGTRRVGGRCAGTSCPAVQVSENVIVDLTGDLLLLQHLLNCLARRQRLYLLPLPVFLLLLQTQTTSEGV